MSQDSLTIIVVTPRHHKMMTFHVSYRLLHILSLVLISLITTISLVAIDHREAKLMTSNYLAANRNLTKAVAVINEKVQSDMIRLRTINLVVKRCNNYNQTLMKMAGLPTSSLEEETMGLGGPVDIMMENDEERLPETGGINTSEELEATVLDQEKSFIYLKTYLEQQSEQLSSTPSIKPVKGSVFLSSGFGFRISPFTRKRNFHAGLDLSGRRGMPIIATADGKVIFAGWQKGYGQTVVIKHGYDYITRYAHNDKLMVKKGDLVKRGDQIATLGSTGYSTGPHCHYEVTHEGRKKNPLNYILNWQYN